MSRQIIFKIGLIFEIFLFHHRKIICIALIRIISISVHKFYAIYNYESFIFDYNADNSFQSWFTEDMTLPLPEIELIFTYRKIDAEFEAATVALEIMVNSVNNYPSS